MMNEKQLQLFFINEVEGNNRKSQCKTILKLLKAQDFVKTATLRMFSYQYNARIYELRRGLYDGKEYLINKAKDHLNNYGFVLLGWKG